MKIPSNFKPLLNKETFRNYCLNPLGYKVQETSFFKKPNPTVKFVKDEFLLHRSEKPLENNVVAFTMDKKFSKPDIKQYLEKSLLEFHFSL